MEIRKLFITLLIIGTCFTSCKKAFLEPEIDNHSGSSRILHDAPFAEGLLLTGYEGLPNSYSFVEAATDDAVSNVLGNPYSVMATGGWTSQFNPLSKWSSSFYGAYTQIYYLNLFLSLNDKVEWAWDDRDSPAKERTEAFRKRFKGEAMALRAWYNFALLEHHGGIATDGKPTGIVLIKTVFDRNANFDIPRDSYDDCVKFILADIDTALSLLPDVYSDHGSDPLYNTVFGSQNKNRVNGQFANALRSRVLLFYASQSFNTDPNKWQSAAVASANLLTEIGGVLGLSPTGNKFWVDRNDRDIIFRRDFQNINSWERSNYPPSLFGQGNINPSQNFVDAFPMRNGYPINSGSSGYDPLNPYRGRDPRLADYVIYNGNNFNGRVVHTNVEDLKDGLNQTINSTRTGYYLKKLLNSSMNISPNINNVAAHFYTFFRYTEIFLNYAEAANEAWGPTADPMSYGLTPVDIIGAIRKRGGIEQPDNHLSSVSSSKDAMREIIHNERRIELSFEGFRFLDLRRWNLNLNEGVKGISISNGQLSIINVEDRKYKPFMKYGPIPKSELLKDNKLLQNEGW